MPDRDYSHRARLDKLGVREGMRVVLDGVGDADFLDELRSRDVALVDGDADIAFLGVEDRAALSRLPAAWGRTGATLWVVYPKGVRTVTEHDVRGAGLALGIVDNKVVRFSDTHTAFRFVPRRTPR